jgi:molybdopterin-binding protein
MNQFKGQVTEVINEGQLSLVRVQVGDITFTTIVIEKPEDHRHLQKGYPITVLFKETEVVIATEANLPISMQNRISGEIVRLEKGKVLSSITLNSSIGKVKSVITSGSVDRLALTPGKTVCAFIKTNEIMLQHD